MRIITNGFGDVTCEGKIAPFDFLALNGVKIVIFTSTTFDHAKFMMRDGKAASISSVNWSRSSYMKNREAGANIEGTGEPVEVQPPPFPPPFFLGGGGWIEPRRTDSSGNRRRDRHTRTHADADTRRHRHTRTRTHVHPLVLAMSPAYTNDRQGHDACD